MPNCWFCYKDAGQEQYHKKCCKKFFGVETAPVLEFNQDLLHELADRTVNRKIAVTGVQPKLSLNFEKNKEASRLTIVGLWGQYILKPQHSTYTSMPETEDLTMHLAALFGINTCEHTLLKATDGSLVYIAKRFDRKKKEKIHVEDFCQLSEFLTAQKYKSSYEKCGKLIYKYCTNTGLDAINYFERVLFSYLTGNNDMHLKNFSLIHNKGSIALSPAYDLLNINLIYPDDKEELALTLNGKKNKIKKEDFVLLANALLIPAKVQQNIFNKFSAANEKVEMLINASFLSPAYKEEYIHIWYEKRRLLTN